MGRTEEITAEKNKNGRVVVDSDRLTCVETCLREAPRKESLSSKK